MNIIFGDSVNLLPKDYLVLELDTVMIRPINKSVQTWCVIETLSPSDWVDLEQKKQLHNDLLVQYRSKDWPAAKHTIKVLLGSWNKELDSFYQSLLDRIQNLELDPPNVEWDGSIEKFISETQ